MKGENKEACRYFKIHPINTVIESYVFEQIKNTDDLHDEGRIQSHCVYSYAKQCEEGSTIIVSMKTSNGERVSTLRFDIKKKKIFRKSSIEFIENRKKFNKSCNNKERAVAQKYFNWLKENIS